MLQQQHAGSQQWRHWAWVKGLSWILEIIGVNTPVCTLYFSSLILGLLMQGSLSSIFFLSSCLSNPFVSRQRYTQVAAVVWWQALSSTGMVEGKYWEHISRRPKAALAILRKFSVTLVDTLLWLIEHNAKRWNAAFRYACAEALHLWPVTAVCRHHGPVQLLPDLWVFWHQLWSLGFVFLFFMLCPLPLHWQFSHYSKIRRDHGPLLQLLEMAGCVVKQWR